MNRRSLALWAAALASSMVSAAHAQQRHALSAARTFTRPTNWTQDAARWSTLRFSSDGTTLTVRHPQNDGATRVLEYNLNTGTTIADRAERVEMSSPDGRIRVRFTPTANNAQCRVDRVERQSGATRSLGILLEPCADSQRRPAPSFSDDGSRVLVVGPMTGSPQSSVLTVIDTTSAAVIARSSYEMTVGGGADPIAELTPRGDAIVWSHNRSGVELVRLGRDAVVFRAESSGALSPDLRWNVELPHCPFARDDCSSRAVLRAVAGRTRIQLAQGAPDSPSSATFSDDGSKLALFVGQRLSVWSVRAQGARKLAEVAATAVFGARFSPDGRSLAVVTAQGVVVYAGF
ncbi:MAG: hypothetical protein U0269_13555 [Polyangiales bacterium]